MPLDHYVPQVHLKNFYSPRLGQRMHAVRKSNLKQFPCNAHSQCRIKNGSTNRFLENPRVVEEFLKNIEPRYNIALNKLRIRKLDQQSVFTIAGFASYIEGCSPCGMRIYSGPIEQTIEAIAPLVRGKNRKAGFETLAPIDLLAPENKLVEASVDRKYTQSFGVNLLMRRIHLWGNSKWDIFINDVPESPFFTSDFPVAIERPEFGAQVLNRVIPLAPDIAIRIFTNPHHQHGNDYRFQNFRARFVNASKRNVSQLNKTIVRCAETTVYYRDNFSWVIPFIAKNRSFRIEPKTEHVPYGKRDFLISTFDVAPFRQPDHPVTGLP